MNWVWLKKEAKAAAVDYFAPIVAVWHAFLITSGIRAKDAK